MVLQLSWVDFDVLWSTDTCLLFGNINLSLMYIVYLLVLWVCFWPTSHSRFTVNQLLVRCWYCVSQQLVNRLQTVVFAKNISVYHT